MTKEDLDEWKQLKTTQEVFANIRAHKLILMEMLSDPSATSRPDFATKQAQLIGNIEGINAIFNIEVANESTRSQDTD
jgi:hypothetical protein